eukprot:CAMPEP_0194336382 /NCGR_PEP_ID=MMETSP0171-20130528/72796_1 /TAXON_ID=218684 /ORGANISM="Corethron pennatum, Strain L29A3" /LENGTH=259 /DNA_ID=CAMNT_0039099809 /DNA_START=146 /DNA_END=926 /DNA_ORIENTATION=-
MDRGVISASPPPAANSSRRTDSAGVLGRHLRFPAGRDPPTVDPAPPQRVDVRRQGRRVRGRSRDRLAGGGAGDAAFPAPARLPPAASGADGGAGRRAAPPRDGPAPADFDGSALLTAESPAGPRGDAQAMLQPNTDGYYLRTIRAVEEQFSDTPNKRKRLFLLVNPAWRDRSSWGFFGGKEAQELILDRYPTTFALDQFVVRGRKISLLKVWSYDWCVFLAPMDFSGDAAELVGSFAERPEYDKIDALIEECIRKKKEK